MDDLKRSVRRPNVYAFKKKERVGISYLADSHLSHDERLLIFGLIRGLRPQRVLEVGSFHGGSASIICAAMEDNGVGILIGLDPAPSIITPERHFFGRFRLIAESSPDGIRNAMACAGGRFDFVHLDGINIYKQAKKDLLGSLEHTTEDAYILINNSYHYGVDAAVREVIASRDDLFDCGFLASTVHCDDPGVAYAGLRLLRKSKQRIANPQPNIDKTYIAAGRPTLKFDENIMNHDVWYCRHVTPCPRCERQILLAATPKPKDE